MAWSAIESLAHLAKNRPQQCDMKYNLGTYQTHRVLRWFIILKTILAYEEDPILHVPAVVLGLRLIQKVRFCPVRIAYRLSGTCRYFVIQANSLPNVRHNTEQLTSYVNVCMKQPPWVVLGLREFSKIFKRLLLHSTVNLNKHSICLNKNNFWQTQRSIQDAIHEASFAAPSVAHPCFSIHQRQPVGFEL